MLTATVETILAATGGTLVFGSPDVVGNDVAVDSREVVAGCVFVALRGERVDGHDFLKQAISAGARVLIVSRGDDELSGVLHHAVGREVAAIRVDDCAKALQDLAAFHRSRLTCAVVGVTGSTGKTTTKDFLDVGASVVDARRLDPGQPEQRAGRAADGACVPEPTPTCSSSRWACGGSDRSRSSAPIARPTIGARDERGRRRTSNSWARRMQWRAPRASSSARSTLDGAAFLNGDDAFSPAIAETSLAPVTYYGLSERCTVRAEDIEVDDAQSRLLRPRH